MTYYLKWLEVALRHSFGRAEKIAAFIGIWIVPGVKALWEQEFEISPALVWEIMAGCLVALVTVRLFLAPYWMHIEDQSEIVKLEGERDRFESQLDARDNTSRLDQAHERLRYVRAALLEQANKAQKSGGMPAENGAWVNTTRQMLAGVLNKKACSRFRQYGSSSNPVTFESTIASLRTLASDLKIEDLKRQ